MYNHNTLRWRFFGECSYASSVGCTLESTKHRSLQSKHNAGKQNLIEMIRRFFHRALQLRGKKNCTFPWHHCSLESASPPVHNWEKTPRCSQWFEEDGGWVSESSLKPAIFGQSIISRKSSVIDWYNALFVHMPAHGISVQWEQFLYTVLIKPCIPMRTGSLGGWRQD